MNKASLHYTLGRSRRTREDAGDAGTGDTRDGWNMRADDADIDEDGSSCGCGGKKNAAA